MKVRISEVIKEIKRKKEEIANLHKKRVRVSYASASEGSAPIFPEETVEDVSKLIAEANERMTHLRTVVTKANIETVDSDGNSISVLIIKLGQLQDELSFYKQADTAEPKVRKSNYNGVEVTHTLYNIKTCQQIAESLRKEIAELQMNIDTLNLTTYVEV